MSASQRANALLYVEHGLWAWPGYVPRGSTSKVPYKPPSLVGRVPFVRQVTRGTRSQCTQCTECTVAPR